ncbi:[protein-PII] uridylyltransferase [Amaricoccus solimangrovi]|uniref:Bifunctional uridylyltransferase/uridylyl-removing enzyme n=1 Tax=Amaricoccus solimangrovi TaxID=2589815 RepID=A0A501WK97_9RHOB|nr:[protein-PII] uridylyltransferase [Amaricoccus solimangrovi]TPE49929.1 [protein-PII] uridylyltransferase [Amaricoccus solimangrovi]
MATERRPAPPPPGWAGLIGSPRTILDIETVRAAIGQAAVGAEDRGAIRAAAVPILRAAYQAGRAEIAAEVAARPREAHRATRDYAWLMDQIVLLTFELATTWLHPNPSPTAAERVALLAVGGYGRAELAPFSDVDLLFLTPYKQTPWGESVIESMLYCLWDLRLKVGHSARTIEECLRLAKTDVTIRTSMLELRFLVGEQPLAEDLSDRLWSELFERTGPEFVQLKLTERAERHKRQGGSRYLLEPNVKEGKGGLRDLQTLFWIAKYLNRAQTPGELVKVGAFTPAEYRVFAEAADFLWMTRVHLHLLANRGVEQLTFDTQVEIASLLGYHATEGQRAVERFMHDYFRHAKSVGDLTRIFLAVLEARHVKPRPSIRSMRRVFTFGREAARQGYRLRNGRLDLIDYEAFLADPVNILRLFQEEATSGIPIHPDALRLVSSNLGLIDRKTREDPEANRIFLTLLCSREVERTLRLMNEVGVLGAFMPEFGRIVAMMQFNMYHHYTVDEHTIQAIATLGKIEAGEYKEALPTSSAIMNAGVNRRVLYAALLLHDIGKGSGRDHSEYGAEIALDVCPRLGFDEADTELVSWLVRHHLVMSDVAQKRDLTEPRTVRDFAKTIKTPTRLRLLTVLTVCDIIGVGPGVWNNWKAVLIRALYHTTMEYLTGGGQPNGRGEREQAAKEALAAALPDWPAEEIEAETSRHYPPYWIGFDTRTHVVFAELARDMSDDRPAIRIELDAARDATEACFAMPDHPGIFARLTGALALAGANIVDARTYTSNNGVATAAFWIQDNEGRPYERARLSRLRDSVSRILAGKVSARGALRDRDRTQMKKRHGDFIVPTRIRFDNLGSDIYTIIEVETRDRPGLLYDLARTLTANNISIASAIIATYGEQAVDVFYVKDLFGLKLHAENRRRALETRLRAAITPNSGPER